MKMWTRIVCLLVISILSRIVSGQLDPSSYGDEWIVMDQTYYKFSTEKEGIYRIPVTSLLEAGIPMNQITGDQFQMFSLGEEIAIRTSTNDLFGPNDFIEFYGDANDGSVDGLLYEDAALQQLNPYISLYSTGRPYYLTWTETQEATDPARILEVSNGLDVSGLPPKEPYYIHHEVRTFEEFHHKPSHDGRNFIRYSSLDYAEGYGSELARTRDLSIPINKLSSFGVDPRVIMRFGTNVLSRNWRVSTDNRTLKLSPQRGYGIVNIDERFPLDELKEGFLNLHIAPMSEENEKHTLARVEVHYPRKYEFDGEVEIKFNQQASIISRYIEIKGFGGDQPVLYNLSENIFVKPELKNGLVRFVTPAGGREHKWMLVDQDQGVSEVSGLVKVNMMDTPSASAYLIISHKELIASGAVQAYADYRASEEGGNYKVSIVDIDQLTERYAYGITGHPIAIKNFMKRLKSENALPDYTFIIGKGREYTEIKEGLPTKALVPTFGIPGSDNLFLAFDHQRHPHKPIGRLAAQTAEEVYNYLDKIKAHEVRTDEEQTKGAQSWKKNVIHLSGGSAGNQATLFRFLNDMGSVLTNNTFGADVFTFRKTSADPIQRATTEDIMSRIDKGAALLTFFGHSAVGSFDFSLEDPVKYNNQGRNPIILSLGCHSGNIHTSNGGISEDFVLEKDRGAIAFIASSGTAYPEPQYFTGINFYNLMGDEMYGLPIGDILQRSLEERTNNPSISVQTLIEQLTLHGDPAYRYGSFKGPDYSIDEESVSIEPGILNATTSKFTLTFDVLNLGAMADDALDVQIVHLLPDGTPADTQMVVLPAPGYSATVSIELDNPNVNWTGTNRLLITIDPDDLIEELPGNKAEKNNDLFSQDGEKGIAFFVFDNSAKPVFPQNFGIYSENKITLRSAVNNGLHPGGRFILQIDTTEHFDSPFLKEAIKDNITSIINWEPDIEAVRGTVYYWRIAPIDDDGRLKSNSWASASFIYLPGSPQGWSQSHFYQWQKDTYYKMDLNTQTRKFEYGERIWDIRIKNEIRNEGDFSVYVNNTPWASLNPRAKGSLLSIFAWDRQEIIFKNNGSDFGSIPFTSDGFIYDMNDQEDVDGILALLDAIPDGARVFFHTMLDSDTSSLNISFWDLPNNNGVSLIDKIESYGATRIRELLVKGTVPYTFIYDKGKGVVIEDIANNIYETIDLTTKARTLWEEGTVTSVAIDQQDRWLRLMWEEEKDEEDQTRILVMGVKPGGARDTLKKISNDYDVNLTSIDPARYPRIELIYQTRDTESKSAPQLTYWRVFTNSLPDAAFYADASSFTIADTLNAGELLELDFDLVNLTDVGMDPILIKYTLIDRNYKEKIIVKRSDKLPGKDTIKVIEMIPTDGLSGDYQVVIEINPHQDQNEVTDCNNLGFSKFYVRPDRRNPFLDVTFDGRHIVDGERVLPTPEIVISLRDETSFLLLDNPEDFEITIYYPQVFEWRVDTTSPVVRWLPATSLEENRASFVITPNFNFEGIYTLEVQAKDIAGNLAGDHAYRITFEVRFSGEGNKFSVAPNPLVHSSEFSYYLDSEFIPEFFDLYIYSADGRLVKHATKSDFGGIKRGLNKYRWYGYSDYGERLTTGLYYFEIVNSIDSRKNKPKGSVLILRN